MMAAFLTLVTCAVTYALWNSQATSGFVIASGNLDITLGEFDWRCADQCATGEGLDSLDDLAIAPGQSVELRQEMIGEFVGDNLMVGLTVSFEELPDGLTGEWHVETGGVQEAPSVGEAALDETLVLPPELSSTRQDWTIVITLTGDSIAQTWADPAAPPQPVVYDLGALTIAADQVRCGPAPAPACPAPETTEAGHGQ